jgi:D-alanine transaminase
LSSGILAGVTRALVIELCAKLGLSCREQSTTPGSLLEADSLFLTSSGLGITEVSALDGVELKSCQVTSQLRRAYVECLREETGP